MNNPLLTTSVELETEQGESFSLSPSDPSELHRALARVSESYCVLDVKNDHGDTMGRATYWLEPGRPDTVYLDWLELAESFRGRGYAIAIVQFAGEYFLAAGLTGMLVKAPTNVPQSRHIYEKMGFRVVSETQNDPLWGGLTLMEKSLN